MTFVWVVTLKKSILKKTDCDSFIAVSSLYRNTWFDVNYDMLYVLSGKSCELWQFMCRIKDHGFCARVKKLLSKDHVICSLSLNSREQQQQQKKKISRLTHGPPHRESSVSDFSLTFFSLFFSLATIGINASFGPLSFSHRKP